MASSILAVLVFFLHVLAHVSVSESFPLRGSVTCLDCNLHHNLSGVLVAVKCSHLESLLLAYTNHRGSLEVEIPAKTPSSSVNCIARMLGGPEQICSLEKHMVSRIIKPQGLHSYALASPLTFFTLCPSNMKSSRPEAIINVESALEAPTSPPPGGELPPGDWGLPPLIYLFPFIPIIGIP